MSAEATLAVVIARVCLFRAYFVSATAAPRSDPVKLHCRRHHHPHSTEEEIEAQRHGAITPRVGRASKWESWVSDH